MAWRWQSSLSLSAQFIGAYYDHFRVGISRGGRSVMCIKSSFVAERVLLPPSPPPLLLLLRRHAAWHGSWVARAIHLLLPPPPPPPLRDGLNVWNLNG